MKSLDLAIATLRDPQASAKAKDLAEQVIRDLTGPQMPMVPDTQRLPVYGPNDWLNKPSQPPPFKVMCGSKHS